MSARSSTNVPRASSTATALPRQRPEQRERLERRRRKFPSVGRRVATMALLVVLSVALLASVPALRGVLHEIGRIGPTWILAAVVLELGSAISFVVVFRLFFDRLPARDARALAWTEQGSGALLPGGGVGGLAVGAFLMRLTGAPLPWIVRRSAGLFFLGGLMSSTALVGGGVALLAGASGPHDFLRVVLPTVVAAIGTLLFAALPPLVASRQRTPRWLSALATGVREAQVTAFNRRPSWRLIGAVGYLGFDIAVLWVTLRALGQVPGIPVVMLAYSIGYAANSLPVPGGAGVLDAGLTGALILYGVSPSQAAAAVIVYHAIAFWIPALGGVFAYLRLRTRLLATATPTALHTANTPSKEATHESRRIDAQTDSARLGGGAHRRSRARPFHRAWRKRKSPTLPQRLLRRRAGEQSLLSALPHLILSIVARSRPRRSTS